MGPVEGALSLILLFPDSTMPPQVSGPGFSVQKKQTTEPSRGSYPRVFIASQYRVFCGGLMSASERASRLMQPPALRTRCPLTWVVEAAGCR